MCPLFLHRFAKCLTVGLPAGHAAYRRTVGVGFFCIILCIQLSTSWSADAAVTTLLTTHTYGIGTAGKGVLVGSDLYWCDPANHAIRLFTESTGALAIYARGASNSAGDSITSGSERYNHPVGISYDGSSALYVADGLNHKVKKIVIGSPPVVTVFSGAAVGTLEAGDVCAGGASTLTRFNFPTGVAYLSSYLYVTDTNNHNIKKLDSAGQCTGIGGGVGLVAAGDSVTGSFAFNRPMGITTDGTYLYVADTFNHKIKKLATDGSSCSIIAGPAAGTASAGFAESSVASNVRLNFPVDVAYHSGSDTIAIADAGNHRIRGVSPYGNVMTTTSVGHLSEVGSGDLTGPASDARLNLPTGIVHAGGTIAYIFDGGNAKVKKVDAGTVATVVHGVAFRNAPTYLVGSGAICHDATYVYIVDMSRHLVFKAAKATNAYRVILGGKTGRSGDVGQAASPTTIESRFNMPSGCTIDTAGNNLYVTDTGNHKIKKISLSTLETTVTNGPAFGTVEGGDDTTLGSGARYNAPIGMTIRGASNTQAMLADSGNHKIKVVFLDSSGPDTIVVGGTAGSLAGGDVCGGTSASNRANFPMHIAGQGTSDTDYHFSDSGNHEVKRLDVTGSWACGYRIGGSAQGGEVAGTGPADTRLNFPTGLSTDGTSYFVSDTGNHKIRTVALAGGVSSVYYGPAFGTISSGMADSSTPTTARFNLPMALAADGTTHTFLLDTYVLARKMSGTASDAIGTFPGNWNFLYLGLTDGTASYAQLGFPVAVATVASDPTLQYVLDKFNHAVRVFDSSSGTLTVSTLAGTSEEGTTDGKGSLAEFSYPSAIAIMGDYAHLAVTTINCVKLITISTKDVATVAGDCNAWGDDDGAGAAARFSSPAGLLVVGPDVFVSDSLNNKIRTIMSFLSSATVTTFAGPAAGSTASGSTNGIGAAARFNNPTGLAAFASPGYMYVVDQGNFKIRSVNLATVATADVAGSGANANTDGIGAAAAFAFTAYANQMATDDVFLYVFSDNALRRIDPVGGTVSTVAGTGVAGTSDNTDNLLATFYGPWGIGVVGTSLVVADSYYGKIRQITGVVLLTTTTQTATLTSAPSTTSATSATATTTASSTLTFTTPTVTAALLSSTHTVPGLLSATTHSTTNSTKGGSNTSTVFNVTTFNSIGGLDSSNKTAIDFGIIVQPASAFLPDRLPFCLRKKNGGESDNATFSAADLMSPLAYASCCYAQPQAAVPVDDSPLVQLTAANHPDTVFQKAVTACYAETSSCVFNATAAVASLQFSPRTDGPSLSVTSPVVGDVSIVVKRENAAAWTDTMCLTLGSTCLVAHSACVLRAAMTSSVKYSGSSSGTDASTNTSSVRLSSVACPYLRDAQRYLRVAPPVTVDVVVDLCVSFTTSRLLSVPTCANTKDLQQLARRWCSVTVASSVPVVQPEELQKQVRGTPTATDATDEQGELVNPLPRGVNGVTLRGASGCGPSSAVATSANNGTGSCLRGTATGECGCSAGSDAAFELPIYHALMSTADDADPCYSQPMVLSLCVEPAQAVAVAAGDNATAASAAAASSPWFFISPTSASGAEGHRFHELQGTATPTSIVPTCAAQSTSGSDRGGQSCGETTCAANQAHVWVRLLSNATGGQAQIVNTSWCLPATSQLLLVHTATQTCFNPESRIDPNRTTCLCVDNSNTATANSAARVSVPVMALNETSGKVEPFQLFLCSGPPRKAPVVNAPASTSVAVAGGLIGGPAMSGFQAAQTLSSQPCTEKLKKRIASPSAVPFTVGPSRANRWFALLTIVVAAALVHLVFTGVMIVAEHRKGQRHMPEFRLGEDGTSLVMSVRRDTWAGDMSGFGQPVVPNPLTGAKVALQDDEGTEAGASPPPRSADEPPVNEVAMTSVVPSFARLSVAPDVASSSRPNNDRDSIQSKVLDVDEPVAEEDEEQFDLFLATEPSAVRRGMHRARFPSHTIKVILFAFQGLTLESVALLQDADSTMIAIGAIGTALCLVFLVVGFGCGMLCKSSMKRGELIYVNYPSISDRPWLDRTRRLFLPSGFWSSQHPHISAFSPLIDAFNSVDIGWASDMHLLRTALVALITVFRPAAAVPCMILYYGTAVIFLLLALVVLVAQPHRRPVDTVVTAAQAILTALLVISQAESANVRYLPDQPLLDVIFYITIAAIVIAVVVTVWEFWWSRHNLSRVIKARYLAQLIAERDAATNAAARPEDLNEGVGTVASNGPQIDSQPQQQSKNGSPLAPSPVSDDEHSLVKFDRLSVVDCDDDDDDTVSAFRGVVPAAT